MPTLNDIESTYAVVQIAGQIPLVPSSMELPSQSYSSSPLKDFQLQTTLSLQHLFRIGTAMSVSWLTGTVAYLPSSENAGIAILPTAQRARIAGQAWARTHARPDRSDNIDDEEPRDLWEEKYHAGLSTMAQETQPRILPDWDVVSFADQESKGLSFPSFWAAEVHELPRGAGIEWAALSGLADCSVLVCGCPAIRFCKRPKLLIQCS